MVLLVLDQHAQEGFNPLGLDDCGGERLMPGGDEAEGHDGGQTVDCVGALRVVDEVDKGRHATSVDDGHGHVVIALADLADESCSVLAHLAIHVLEAVEHLWEDLGIDDSGGQVLVVLGDLRQSETDVLLDSGVVETHKVLQVVDGTSVHDHLGQFLVVLGDFAEGVDRGTFQSELRLL